MTVRRLILAVAAAALVCSLAEVERTDTGWTAGIHPRVDYIRFTGADGKPYAWAIFVGKGYYDGLAIFVGSELSLRLLRRDREMVTWTIWQRRAGR